jgi:hypothetical protein
MKNKVLKVLMLSLVITPAFAHSPDAKTVGTSPVAVPVVKETKNPFVSVPSLSFSGDVAFELATIDNKIKKNDEIQAIRMGLGKLFLNAKAEGEASNGLIYSFNTRIFTDTNNAKKNTLSDADKKLVLPKGADGKDQTLKGVDIREAVTIFDRVWLEMKGAGFGTVHVGNYVGAYNVMIEDASSIFGGNGGAITGNWSSYYTLPYGVVKEYRQTADTRASTKISYYTPRFEGIQLGASYTPRSDSFGGASYQQETLNGADSAGQHVFGLGVNFAKEFSGVNVKIGASGLKGQGVDKAGKTDTLEDVLSWEVSARVTTGPFDIAGGYVDNGKSLLEKTGSKFKDAGSLYDVAASYTIGAAKIALGGMWTSHTFADDKKATLGAYSVTVDYTIEKGLYAYLDVTKLTGDTDDDKARDANKTKDNKEIGNSNSGYVGFIGIGVSF